MPKASSLGDYLQRQLGAEIQLIAGSGGVYVVVVDGREVFSKATQRRMPDPDEIVAIIKGLQ